jgi:hypothetical protein
MGLTCFTVISYSEFVFTQNLSEIQGEHLLVVKLGLEGQTEEKNS